MAGAFGGSFYNLPVIETQGVIEADDNAVSNSESLIHNYAN